MVADLQEPGLTLGAAAHAFAVRRSPQVIVAVLVTALAARVALGRWSWWDLLAPALIVAAQPFTEWVIHVFLLHFRPRRVRGRTLDPLVARKHRDHHADPRDVSLVFVPMPALLLLVLGLAAVLLLALPLARALSALVAAYAMLFAYEWTHYLIHTAYRPRHVPYRAVWRAHRNHHFRNEHYWFGVTMHLADRVLGTFPERGDVEVSPTARTLGVETRLNAPQYPARAASRYASSSSVPSAARTPVRPTPSSAHSSASVSVSSTFPQARAPSAVRQATMPRSGVPSRSKVTV